MGHSTEPVVYEFGAFRLDTSHRRIIHTSKGSQLLTPRLYQILVALLENPGEVVTKEKLIAQVWKEQFVEEGNLSRNISTLRKRLGEDPRNPQYIDTIARVGYRFIAPVRARPVSAPDSVEFRRRSTVGRHTEYLDFLKAAFDRLEAGMGNMLAITGEAGIGKTTFVLDSLDHLARAGVTFQLARGRSSERLAGTEAFLPLLEALQDLLRGPKGSSAKDTLRRVAPSWYRYLHSSEMTNLKSKSSTRSPADPQELLKIELNAFLREITKDGPLVLFLDDVHWADLPTIDLLSYLMDKVSALRLLVVLAYRPSELHITNHPLTKVYLNWKGRGTYQELPLDFLTVEDVYQYINQQYPEHDFPREFPAFIQSRTAGNPLFMCDLIRYMENLGFIVQSGTRWKLSSYKWAGELPESIRAMIERKIGQLGGLDRRIMVTASVQGEEFDSSVIARVLEIEDAEIEGELATLDRIHGFVRLVREREAYNGTPILRYRFVHVLYRNALLASIPPTRRAKLHHAVAQTLLECEGPRANAIATQLAALFEGARDYALAGKYFLIAAESARSVSAYSESLRLARHGLGLIRKLPDRPERAAMELSCLLMMGRALL